MRLKILPFFSFVVLTFASLNMLASDTLTRRQIFNFQVGDSFSYTYHSRYSGTQTYSDDLRVFLNKAYSLDSSEVTFLIEYYQVGYVLFHHGFSSHDTFELKYKDLDSFYVEGFGYDGSGYQDSIGIRPKMMYDSANVLWSKNQRFGMDGYSFGFDNYWAIIGLSYAERLGITSKGESYEGDNSENGFTLQGYTLADGRHWGQIRTSFPTSLEDVGTPDLRIYPNPFTDKLHIDFNETLINANSTIVIRDIYGKVIKELKDLHQQNEISLADESPGLYFLTLQSETNSQTWKVIKE